MIPSLDAILSRDPTSRSSALADARSAPEHVRSVLATRLAVVTRSASDPRFPYGVAALASLRVDAAKNALLRIADEEPAAVKAALAEALAGVDTAEARAVLVHLLSDDEARYEALRAIAVAPWPAVLPALIEIAEADDRAARIVVRAIAMCGERGSAAERNAAADFLVELLDDDAVVGPAALAILRYGRNFPGVLERARRLAKEGGLRKAAGVCLVAFCSDEGAATLLELALSGEKTDQNAVRGFLEPLLADPDDALRDAAERAARALDLPVNSAS